MTEHTPAPWEMYSMTLGSRGALFYLIQKEDELIGEVEKEANARLIAAAPDLLAACDANMLILKSNYNAIKSLPFEALGVVEATHEHGGYPIRDEQLHDIACQIAKTEAAIAKTKAKGT